MKPSDFWAGDFGDEYISRNHAVPVFRWLADLLQACDYTAAHGWQRQ